MSLIISFDSLLSTNAYQYNAVVFFLTQKKVVDYHIMIQTLIINSILIPGKPFPIGLSIRTSNCPNM